MPAETASGWVRRWSHLVPAGARVLDVACGGGRHLRWFAGRGCRVTGVDRDPAALASSAGLGELIVADIEAGSWPFGGREFEAVVVSNYLWRPRWAAILGCVAREGLLIYETFAAGQETVGRPADPRFLLRPGELLEAAAGLRVIAYEDGFEPHRDPGQTGRFVQRIVAMRQPVEGRRCELAGSAGPAR